MYKYGKRISDIENRLSIVCNLLGVTQENNADTEAPVSQGAKVPAFDEYGTSEVRITSAVITKLSFDRVIHISNLPIDAVKHRWKVLADELYVKDNEAACRHYWKLCEDIEFGYDKLVSEGSGLSSDPGSPHDSQLSTSGSQSKEFVVQYARRESPLVFAPIVTGINTVSSTMLTSINLTPNMIKTYTKSTLWGVTTGIAIGPPFVKTNVNGEYKRQFQMQEAEFIEKVKEYRVQDRKCEVNDKAVARRLNRLAGISSKDTYKKNASVVVEKDREEFARHWFDKILSNDALVNNEDIVIISKTATNLYENMTEDYPAEVTVFEWQYEYDATENCKDPVPTSLRFIAQFSEVPFCVVDNFVLDDDIVRASIGKRIRRKHPRAPYFEVDTNREDIFKLIKRISVDNTNGVSDSRVIDCMTSRSSWYQSLFTENEQTTFRAAVTKDISSQKLLCPIPIIMALMSTRDCIGQEWMTEIADEIETAVIRKDHMGYMIGRLSRVSLRKQKQRENNSDKRVTVYYGIRGGMNNYLNVWT